MSDRGVVGRLSDEAAERFAQRKLDAVSKMKVLPGLVQDLPSLIENGKNDLAIKNLYSHIATEITNGTMQCEYTVEVVSNRIYRLELKTLINGVWYYTPAYFFPDESVRVTHDMASDWFAEMELNVLKSFGPAQEGNTIAIFLYANNSHTQAISALADDMVNLFKNAGYTRIPVVMLGAGIAVRLSSRVVQKYSRFGVKVEIIPVLSQANQALQRLRDLVSGLYKGTIVDQLMDRVGGFLNKNAQSDTPSSNEQDTPNSEG